MNRVEYISQFVYYCPESPSGLRWASDRRRGFGGGYVFIRAGEVAGSKNATHGRYIVRVNGVDIQTHVLVWELFNGPLSKDLEIDHEDGNHENNRIENLRAVTHAVNCRNRKQRKDNNSGTTGVIFFDKESRYRVYWSEGGKLRSKSFSVNAYGSIEGAFQAAVGFRIAKLGELNAAGAGYTARHGQNEGEKE